MYLRSLLRSFFLNHNHITIVFGSCQGALRKSIDFYLSYTKTLTQQILQTQNESRILKKRKESYGK